MKNIKEKLIELFKKDYCTPQIARIAKKLKEPTTTLHYNIKKLEEEKAIISYKAVMDYKKIGYGHCTYILINLSQDHYLNPEEIAEKLAQYEEVESVDIIIGDFELILKTRHKDIDHYYEFSKLIIKEFKFPKMKSLTSLKQTKSEFVKIE